MQERKYRPAEQHANSTIEDREPNKKSLKRENLFQNIGR
jgi:hypothetical protein